MILRVPGLDFIVSPSGTYIKMTSDDVENQAI
jgi:hypothetical protein